MKRLLKIGFVAVAILVATPKLYAQISVGISITANVAPPPLPVYTQPACPVDGYLWSPGYWAWDPDVQDYYWIPGVWVAAPQPGYLWTPAYWGYTNGVYGFHAGYWGPHVGFYGGINYGYGYGGVGFVGGNWQEGHFRYNTAVVNVNTTVVHNTYVDKTVIVNNTVVNNSHTSFNGAGGVQAKPRPEELAAAKDNHIQATTQQQSHQQTARQDKTQFSKSNGGTPANVAMNRVGGAHFNAQGTRAPRQPQANRPMNGNNANQQQNNQPNGNNARPNMNQNDADHNNAADNKTNNQANQTDNNKPDNQQRPANNQQMNQPKNNQHPKPQGQGQQHKAPRPQRQAAHRPEKEHK